MDLTDTPEVATISKMETPETKSTPEIKDISAKVVKTEIKDISEKGMVVTGYTMHIKSILKDAG